MKRSAVVVFLAALLAAVSPAHAASTVITDPAGDATICRTYNGTSYYTCPYLDPIVGSDPTIDIVSLTVGANAADDLVVEQKVTNLDDWMTTSDNKRTAFTVNLRGRNDDLSITVSAMRFGDATVGYLTVTGNGSSLYARVITPVVFDPLADIVRWVLPLDRLNEMLEQTCPSCTDLVVGETLGHFMVADYRWLEVTVAHMASEVRETDTLYSETATYNLGD